MNAPEVLQAYRDKYKSFPDLVERIVSQFDYDFWQVDNLKCTISLEEFARWIDTKEGEDFWDYLRDYEVDEDLTHESIDAAYKEFGIEVDIQRTGLHYALQLNDLRPLLLRHPDKEMVTKSCLHFLGDEAQQWWNEREENKEKS